MYKVMIVDDETLFRDYLRTKMDWEQHGFEVCCEARNGKEALGEAERTAPHLALVDINMPFMSGLELAEKLKEKFERMAIVFVTGHNEFEYMQKAVQIGVHDYLLKPFNRKELAAMLERVKPRLPVLEEAEAFEPEGHAVTKGDFNAAEVQESLLLSLRMKDSEIIDELHKRLRTLRAYELQSDYAYTMLMGLVSLAVSFAAERGIDLDRVMEQALGSGDRLRSMQNWEEAEAWMLHLYRRLVQLTQDVRPTKSSNLFQTAKAYIEKHYTDPELSAEQVAGAVFVDPSYLRKVFRKESGSSVVDLITYLRMKRAKELLLQGNMRLADVAAASGYSDPNYFSKSFKKRFGMTPTEYEQLRTAGHR
ncbi:two-component system response regulator YesN [Paenibacillus phyllosphaerae]|uniref:Two-component system response regulator YesN n=1 Tax=Paenibacillus phyllosphaerae TaxID=274593 RepID=A0A7W5B410_9BACL|nr:response regulator [Paenibacillus phyllosphaerae]MBB3113769.1 two-component system response regulator YesN [Paenibacillus phyllosphaerae]